MCLLVLSTYVFIRVNGDVRMIFRKMLLLVAIGMSFAVYAADDSDMSVNTMPSDNPSIGSRQGSNQTFGQPAVTGKPHEVFNASQPYSANNLNTTGSLQGSDQTFGKPQITGTKGQVYNTKPERSHGANNPAVGTRNGSNQLFVRPIGSKNNASDSND